MIKKLQWDSDFFDYPVGKITISTKDEYENLNLSINKNYKLLYIFSNEALEIQNNLVDKKVTLHKQITNPSKKNGVIEYNIKEHSFDELLELTYLSGSHSRFKTDMNFTHNEFKKLYKEWIIQSIEKKIAFSILIKYINQTIAGFITLQKKNNNTCSIGLIAVSQLYQGRKIATDLIKHGEYISYKNGFTNIEVATQLDNTPALNLYKKNNFTIKQVSYIYHLWN